ncbi:hypothetical protein AB0D29_34005 [Streptomyces sp. NPDC048424]|uniref:hypothetical protein n=1 Tax=Streptomyces sp. NPDC048424 TaxID=3155265 RepID=UPI00342E17D2
MGNSVAYPVHRTTDPAEAYAKARLLCGLPARRYEGVRVGAELSTVAGVPEVRSYASPKYDGVQLVLNGDHCDWSRQVGGVHTLYVHVTKFGDPGRAERLAAAVGGSVLGEPEQG